MSKMFTFPGLEKERDDYYRMFLDMHHICKAINFFPYGSDELLIGRAGYLSGVLELNKKLKPLAVPQDVTQALFHSMVSCGKKYAQHHHHGNQCLMYAYYDTEYLGNHGNYSQSQLLGEWDKPIYSVIWKTQYIGSPK